MRFTASKRQTTARAGRRYFRRGRIDRTLYGFRRIRSSTQKRRQTLRLDCRSSIESKSGPNRQKKGGNSARHKKPKRNGKTNASPGDENGKGTAVGGQFDLFDKKTAKEHRDSAIDRVSSNNQAWLFDALAHIPKLAGETMTGEEIRLQVEIAVGPPKHHNAWGALIRQAIKEKLLIPTGQYKAMETPKSHARRTPAYWIKEAE